MSDVFTAGEAREAAPVAIPDSYTSLSRADRVAVLIALRDAIDTRVKEEKSGITESLYGATETQKIPTTGFGDLSFRPPKTPVKIDDEKLLEYVEHVAPEAITEQVSVTRVIDPGLRDMLIKDVIDVGDGLFARGSTGEEIHYAHQGSETAPQVVWGASSEQKRAKVTARKILDEHLPAMVVPVIEQAAS